MKIHIACEGSISEECALLTIDEDKRCSQAPVSEAQVLITDNSKSAKQFANLERFVILVTTGSTNVLSVNGFYAVAFTRNKTSLKEAIRLKLEIINLRLHLFRTIK